MILSDRFPIKNPVIALVGPTAIGKTELSLSIANKFECEIISLDSVQVYRYMDIGTAKASPEERRLVPHHLIDIVDPDTPYDASSFTNDALKAIREIHGRNKIPLLAGGTGLYLRSLTEGLFDEVGKFPQLRKELNERLRVEGRSKLHEELSSIDCNSAIRIHVNDTQRLLRALEIYYATGTSWTEHLKKQPLKNSEKRFAKILQLGLTCDRGLLYDRINQRTLDMINNGLKEEVEGLVSKGYDRNLKSMQSIGYRHMISYLFDGWTDEKLKFLLSRDTRRYAKRQLTWFKKMNTEWHDVSQRDDILNRINKFVD
jgi:tRNA dimethylallyltransferase